MLTLHGEIVGPGLSYLATVLADLIDGQGNLAVVVDLGGLRRLDRSAVEVLATAAHSIGRRGGRLALGRPSADAAEVLDWPAWSSAPADSRFDPRSLVSSGPAVHDPAPEPSHRPGPTELKSPTREVTP